MAGAELVLVAASITKLANLIEREKLADLRVPFVARFGVAVISLACFFQVGMFLSSASFGISHQTCSNQT